ncbi:MAG: hypothetical protein KC733_07235, partial [Candidatus Omnitrophica bacterium]|nr:hypothetical protein [Candidatus Omnitrophota bacterium]
MTLIHTLALFLFIHSIPLFNPFVWQLLFLIRIIFDITGHSYELNHLMGIYQFNPSTGIILLICVLVPLIPSYIASYLYAVS